MGNFCKANLNKALGVLDDLITEKLNPESSSFQLTHENIEQCRSVAKDLKETIQKTIYDRILELSEKKRISCFIQNYQSRLVYLADKLTNYIEIQNSLVKDELHLEYFRTLKAICTIVVDLLVYINRHYAKYFNSEEHVPLALKEKAKEQFGLKLQEIDKISPNSELVNIATFPVREFLSDENDIVFQKLAYLKTLLDTVLNTCKTAKNLEETLKQELFYLNFNSYHFFRYMVNEIEKQLQETDDYHLMLAKLLWHKKLINQMDDGSGLCLNIKQASIKQQVSCWIAEELNYMEKCQQFYSFNRPETITPDREDFKVIMAPSVSQMAYILKIMFKIKMILNPSQRKVINFLSQIFQSQQVSTISAKSLRNRFYNVEDSTKEAVKAILIKMLNEINNDR